MSFLPTTNDWLLAIALFSVASIVTLIVRLIKKARRTIYIPMIGPGDDDLFDDEDFTFGTGDYDNDIYYSLGYT